MLEHQGLKPLAEMLAVLLLNSKARTQRSACLVQPSLAWPMLEELSGLSAEESRVAAEQELCEDDL